MKAVIQRVRRARVVVSGEVVGEIGHGILVLLGVMRGDTESEAKRLAQRIAQFRIFEDQDGRMNLSALQGVGEGPLPLLVVSQFTLSADGKKGRRPSFDRAEEPRAAQVRLAEFVQALEGVGLAVFQGRFGAHMQVEMINDGPATFVLEDVPAPRP